MKVVSVRDIVASQYGNPIFVAHSSIAVRSFGDEIAKGDGNPFALHPEDYELVELGDFDQSTGKFVCHETPVQLIAGANFRRN